MKKRNTFTRLAAAAILSGIVLISAPAVLAQTGEKPYTYVEQMPQFKGGEAEMLKFLADNIKYPDKAKTNGLEGLVVVQFIVEKDGAITEVQPVKKLGHGTDEEAIRVIKQMSGKWTSGKQGGKNVRVRYTLPIRFALGEADRAATANIVNKEPQFIGGQEAMLETIKPYLALPAEAKQENLNARVLVRFYVDKDGKVSNIRLDGTKLKKTVGPGSDLDYMDASTFSIQNKAILAKLSEAAVAAVKATSGKWYPANKNGQPAAAEVVLPVQFLNAEGGENERLLHTPTMTKYIKPLYSFEEADVKPAFEDGSVQKFLAKNLRFPKDSDFEGYVEVGFTTKADGTMSGPSMVPSRGSAEAGQKAVHDEIRRVVRLMNGKWTPGRVDGQAVDVIHTLTIRFTINDGTIKPAEESEKNADVTVTTYK